MFVRLQMSSTVVIAGFRDDPAIGDPLNFYNLETLQLDGSAQVSRPSLLDFKLSLDTAMPSSIMFVHSCRGSCLAFGGC